MDPVYNFPASPGTPLFPVSPERANRQHILPQQQQQQQHHLAQSPSLPALPAFLAKNDHVRGDSDVQGKVAQFNNLAKDAAQRRKDNEAALKRAILGREEAEGESRKLRDENSGLRKEVEEGRGRERTVSDRLERLQVRFAPMMRGKWGVRNGESMLTAGGGRRNCKEQKRSTAAPRQSTRRKSDARGKKRSNLPARRSICRRSSKAHGIATR